jgi:hypothetical protein
LLRDERRTLGRYDGRFEGIDFDAAGEEPTSDPSSTTVVGAFTAAFNSYLAEELNYSLDTLIRSAMVYLNPDARKAFRADLGKFYDSAAQP